MNTEWKLIRVPDSNEYAYIAEGNRYIIRNIRIEVAERIVSSVNGFKQLQADKDRLIKEGITLSNCGIVYRHEIEELQAKLDAALNLLAELQESDRIGGNDAYYDLIEKLLKGGE